MCSAGRLEDALQLWKYKLRFHYFLPSPEDPPVLSLAQIPMWYYPGSFINQRKRGTIIKKQVELRSHIQRL
jgi:hypothetical protein